MLLIDLFIFIDDSDIWLVADSRGKSVAQVKIISCIHFFFFFFFFFFFRVNIYIDIYIYGFNARRWNLEAGEVR